MATEDDAWLVRFGPGGKKKTAVNYPGTDMAQIVAVDAVHGEHWPVVTWAEGVGFVDSLLAFVDADGTKHATANVDWTALDVAQLPDGGAVVVGGRPTGGGDRVGWIRRYNSEGEKQWEAFPDISNILGTVQVSNTEDLILAGSTEDKQLVGRYSLEGTQKSLDVFDFSGSMQGFVYDIVEADDETLYLAGNKGNSVGGDGVIRPLKPDGTTQSEITAITGEPIEAIEQTDNGDLVVTGKETSKRLSTEGTERWSVTMPGFYGSDLVKTGDGGYIVVGEAANQIRSAAFRLGKKSTQNPSPLSSGDGSIPRELVLGGVATGGLLAASRFFGIGPFKSGPENNQPPTSQQQDEHFPRGPDE